MNNSEYPGSGTTGQSQGSVATGDDTTDTTKPTTDRIDATTATEDNSGEDSSTSTEEITDAQPPTNENSEIVLPLIPG